MDVELDDTEENEVEWCWVDKDRLYGMRTSELEDWKKKLVTAANDLKEKGYAVIENVLSPKECENVKKYMKEWNDHQEKYALSYARKKISQEITPSGDMDVEKEEKPHDIKWANTHHIMTAHGYNSSKIAREMRRHPMVCSVFRALYGNRCDLLSSQDRVNVLKTGQSSLPRGQWPHLDLNVRKKVPEDNTVVIQSYVSVTAQGTDENDVEHGVSGNRFYVKKVTNEDGTTKMKGTHTEFTKRWANRRTSEKSDWYALLCEDVEQLKRDGFELVKPSHGEGAMVLWDSRCVHDPFAERVTPNEAKNEQSQEPFKRLVFYVCMIPSPIFCKERAKIHDYTPVNLNKFDIKDPKNDKYAMLLYDTIIQAFDNEKKISKQVYLECDATRHAAYPRCEPCGGDAIFSRLPSNNNNRYQKAQDAFVEVGEKSSVIHTCPFVHHYDEKLGMFDNQYARHRFDSLRRKPPKNEFEKRTFGFVLFESEKFERNTLNLMISNRIDEDDRENDVEMTKAYLRAEKKDRKMFDESLHISKTFSNMLRDIGKETRLKMCHNYLPLEHATLSGKEYKVLKAKDAIEKKERNKLLTDTRNEKKTSKRPRSTKDEKNQKEEEMIQNKKARFQSKMMENNNQYDDDTEAYSDPFENTEDYYGQPVDYDYVLNMRDRLI